LGKFQQQLGDQYTAWGINIGLGGSIKNSGVSTSFSDEASVEVGES